MKRGRYIFTGQSGAGKKTLMKELNDLNLLAPIQVTMSEDNDYRRMRHKYSAGFSSKTQVTEFTDCELWPKMRFFYSNNKC